MDGEVCAAQPVAFLLEYEGYATYIVAPVSGAPRVGLIEIEFNFFGKVVRVNVEASVIAGIYGRVGIEVDRGRHDKAFVVVGMFADQVDPGGSAVGSGFG